MPIRVVSVLASLGSLLRKASHKSLQATFVVAPTGSASHSSHKKKTTFRLPSLELLGTGLEPVRFYSADFKSAASTIPPPEQLNCRNNTICKILQTVKQKSIYFRIIPSERRHRKHPKAYQNCRRLKWNFDNRYSKY